MMSEVTAWPVVLSNDAGIRPSGSPDRCLYCSQRIGQPHGADCVCVLQRVQYGVYVNGIRVGIYQSNDPYFWTSVDCDFHKNESSWCSDNALENIQWSSEAAKSRIAELMENNEGCSCSLLEFRFEAVVVDGPFRYEE